MDSLRAALQTHFGHADFRPHQEAIIRQALDGRDTLGVLPTGAGKSLCYQLPALLLPRPTLVISPLIALMQDQVSGLPPALYEQSTLINSSVEAEELDRRLVGIEIGQYRLIYAAPERLRQQSFLNLLATVAPSLVVVDEAHCVSVWGHDFRPDYLFIRKALESLSESGEPPTVLALTATATQEMQAEIAAQLGRELETVAASTFRPNLRLEVFRCANADDKMKRLAAICKQTPGAAIVYANSRDRCEKLALFLKRQGVQADFYHAGLDSETRRATQESFMLGRARVMVATVAFGMGIDKANVRLVAHFTLPESLEAYTQEAGRAGRDGQPSRCALLFASSDKANLSRWLKQEEVRLETVRDAYRAVKARLGRRAGLVPFDLLMQEALGNGAQQPGAETKTRVALSLLERVGLLRRHPDSGRNPFLEVPPAPPNARAELESILEARGRHHQARLEEMVAYAEGTGCRHARIARHFGQPMEPCGDACDRCLGTAEEVAAEKKRAAPTAGEVPDVGRVALECLASLPRPLGRTGAAKVLTGAADSPVPQHRCARFGALAGCTLNAARAFLDTLTEQGLLHLDREAEYPLLSLTAAGGAALKSDAVILPNPKRPPEPPSEEENDRFERLRAWRRVEAERADLPPYFILQDATLRALAAAAPSTLEDFQAIPGIGSRKTEQYGPAVLEILQGANGPNHEKG